MLCCEEFMNIWQYSCMTLSSKKKAIHFDFVQNLLRKLIVHRTFCLQSIAIDGVPLRFFVYHIFDAIETHSCDSDGCQEQTYETMRRCCVPHAHNLIHCPYNASQANN